MKALLTQLALITGGCVAILSFVRNLSQRMDLLTAAFRSALVFLATVVVLFLFLQFFLGVLMRFVAEQVVQKHHKETDNAKQEKPGNAAKLNRVNAAGEGSKS